VLLGPLFLLVGCGSSSGGIGRTPPGSTETGNPPVIDVTKVALLVKRGEVHVTGEDGAVTPGGAELEIETLSSGDAVHGTSDSKGAFDIQVDGTVDDTYQLRALGTAKDVKSAPVYLYRGGASVGEGDGGMFSCEQRATVIDDQLTQAASAADHACSTNADCTIVSGPVDCPGWVCSGAALSQSGAAEVAPSLDAIRAGMCKEFDDVGCWMGWPVPECVNPRPAACVNDRCVDCAKDDCSGASCDPCETPEIIWAPTGPMIGDAHTIVDCKTLVTSYADSKPQCTTRLPCTVSSSGGSWSFAHIQNLLGDPTVKAALESDASFRVSVSDHSGGRGTTITVGSHSIHLGELTSCGGDPSCTEPPLQVQNLFALLNTIAIDQSCAAGPNPGEACDMPFDPGTGSESIGVYAFDGPIGNCIPQLYSGAGGNGNRFDSFASCQAVCRPTAAADTCPSDRVYVADSCLGCGFAGGCVPQGDACMLRCTDSTDCTDPMYGSCRAGGTCGLIGCL
jgi:hypothetical protein